MSVENNTTNAYYYNYTNLLQNIIFLPACFLLLWFSPINVVNNKMVEITKKKEERKEEKNTTILLKIGIKSCFFLLFPLIKLTKTSLRILWKANLFTYRSKKRNSKIRSKRDPSILLPKWCSFFPWLFWL